MKLTLQKEIKLPAGALALDVSPDGKSLFAACQDGGVYSADPVSGETRLLGRHQSYASGVAVLPDGKTLITGGYDGALHWYDLATSNPAPVREVKAHDFWSWDLALSRDGSLVASVTGRYEVGSYKYEPAPEIEPSVRVFDARTGELRHQFPHIPPTQALAFTPDGAHLAAGNLMGEVRIWELATGKQAAQWKTDDLTSWGIIKSHHYLGGIFAMHFSPDSRELYICGMGPMNDPMAGNGVQRWQRFDWSTGKRLDQTHDGESGRGLMEALAFHPSGKFFAMAGRLVQGSWNLAFFDASNGKNLFNTDAKHRITELRFSSDGSTLYLAKTRGQDKPKDGHWPDYGLLEIHSVSLAS